VVVVRRARVLCLVLTLLAGGTPHAAAPEYQVKAAFLFNFARFVEWPTPAMAASPAFRICVVGDDPFGPLLSETLSGKTVHERPIQVDHPATTTDILACHIAYIAPSESSQLPRLLAAIAGRSVLTVGETTEFASRGGMIGMHLEDNKVRFDVNAEAAQQAGLRVSSQLLKLAVRVIQ
jgi:hypothetical protein